MLLGGTAHVYRSVMPLDKLNDLPTDFSGIHPFTCIFLSHRCFENALTTAGQLQISYNIYYTPSIVLLSPQEFGSSYLLAVGVAQ